jgi:hypothetical protein
MTLLRFILIGLFLYSLNGLAQDFNMELKKLDDTMLLSDFIKNQAYEYLEFKLVAVDSIEGNGVSMSHGSKNAKVIIKTGPSLTSKEPGIVLNQYPIDNWCIIQSIELKDIKSIYLHKYNDTISALYGTWGKYGVIVTEVKKQKLRKLKREFGRRLGN